MENKDPLAAFAAHQDAAATAPNYLGDPAVSLKQKAAAIDLRLQQLTQPDCPPNARAEISELVKSLTWPVKQADGTTINRPLKLTLSRQDLCFRLWKQDGNGTEVQRSWKADAKVVFFVALHEPRELAPLLSDLSALLVAVYEFVDAQLTSYEEQNLMVNVMDSLWEAHHANMAAPAPAPYGTHDSGNAPGLIGNLPSGQN